MAHKNKMIDSHQEEDRRQKFNHRLGKPPEMKTASPEIEDFRVHSLIYNR